MIEALLALLFGLVIGSFLNVCVYRLPRDLSVVRPRSHCPQCAHMVAWYDNIPLVSFVILGGRCRHCGERISWRYPVVEAMTGALFFNFVYVLGPGVAALKMCVLAALLVGCIFTDIEQRILPDEFTLGGTLIAFVFCFFTPVPDSVGASMLSLAGVEVKGVTAWIAEAAIGAGIPALFLWSAGAIYFRVRHKDGLGFGDVKLIAMVGAFLGLSGALWTLIFGGISGTIIGGIYVKSTGKDFGSYELPFGAFLGAAAVVLALMGHSVS